MFKKLFVPSDDSDLTHMALLVARLWFGLTMLFNHGFDKLAHFNDIVGTFPDPLRLGQEASLMLVVLAEVLGALLLTVGLMTRVAAAVLVIDMFVAFLMVHKTAHERAEQRRTGVPVSGGLHHAGDRRRRTVFAGHAGLQKIRARPNSAEELNYLTSV